MLLGCVCPDCSLAGACGGGSRSSRCALTFHDRLVGFYYVYIFYNVDVILKREFPPSSSVCMLQRISINFRQPHMHVYMLAPSSFFCKSADKHVDMISLVLLSCRLSKRIDSSCELICLLIHCVIAIAPKEHISHPP
jgi:hypothetical protein